MLRFVVFSHRLHMRQAVMAAAFRARGVISFQKGGKIMANHFLSSVQQSAALAKEQFVGAYVRFSRRADTAQVCVVCFRNSEIAAQFARAWAKRIPDHCRGIIVRHLNSDIFAASVPLPEPVQRKSDFFWALPWPVLAGGKMF